MKNTYDHIPKCHLYTNRLLRYNEQTIQLSVTSDNPHSTYMFTYLEWRKLWIEELINRGIKELKINQLPSLVYPVPNFEGMITNFEVKST